MICAGIMTGTSLDGVDIALCRFAGTTPVFSPIGWETLPYPEAMARAIQQVLTTECHVSAIAALHTDIGRFYAEAVTIVANKYACPVTSIEVIGMHGQTLHHLPPHHTFQAGCISTVAVLTGCVTVGDFRTADVACGGQGAPLMPLFDFLVVADCKEHRAALNIGGMANITILPAACTESDIIGFDTGPGNILIDTATRLLYGKQYDEDGHVGRAGRLIPPMLVDLMEHPFLATPPPKSTGREIFSPEYAERVIRRYSHPSIPYEDVVTTFTEFTAQSIVQSILISLPSVQRILVSGGGHKNSFLMERLAALAPSVTVEATTAVNVDPDGKEAFGFAYLAWRRIMGMTGNLPSVTGASKAVPLGVVAIPGSGV